MDSEFERQLFSGAFKNNKDFIENKDNLKNIIKYLNAAKISPQVMDLVLNLLKFYRFPIALCCSQLYSQIEKASLQEQNALKDKLLEIAAYMKSLLSEMELKIFPQIQFFFKWGQAKKKYKISNVFALEKEFLSFIIELSNTKKELQSLIQSEASMEEKRQKINVFLSKTWPQMNVFEERCIEHMKASCADIIQAIYQQQEKAKDKKMSKKPMKKKSVQKIQVQHQKDILPNRIDFISSQTSMVANPNKLNQQVYVGFIQKPQQKENIKYLCCRTFFYDNEVIEYPQSLRTQYKHYSFPFKNNPNQNPGKQQKIKRTICGFLNAQGGIIYFGIKELTETKKRIAVGLLLSERKKKQFTKMIMRLSSQVLPDVGKKCTVKYVPLKDKNSCYITGQYVAKVIVSRGAKNQVYSYIYQRFDNYNIQKFTFRTQNQVLQISSIQRILKIFKNKLQQPEREFYPTHPNPCIEPQAGKPLYDKQYQEYEEQKQEKQQARFSKPQRIEYQKKMFFDPDEVQSYQSENTEELQKYQQPQTWLQQQQRLKKAKYMQKESLQILINCSLEDTDILLKRQFIPAQTIINVDYKNWTLVQLKKAKDARQLETLKVPIIQVYSRISYQGLEPDQIVLMQEIILEYRNKWSVITRQTKDKILIFKSSKPACKFYLRMMEMGLKVKFTPMI